MWPALGTRAHSDASLAMRIPFAVPGHLAAPTGGYAYARRLIEAAAATGLTLDVMALPDGFPQPGASRLAQAGDLLAGLPAHVPILIDGLAYGALPATVLDRVAAPVVALCHHPLALETGLEDATADRLRRSEMMALACAKHVITTSEATAAILTADFDVPAEKLSVAKPGTDLAIRATGSGSAETCRLLSVGSVTPRKGHPALIAALAPLADMEWTLRIAGPHRDSDALRALQDAIAQAGLTKRVALLGAVDDAALDAEYFAADAFVLASNYEGFGMAFTEAMARGLPTMGLDLGSDSAAVREATAGGACLVTPDSLSQALASWIVDPASRSLWGQRAWEVAQAFPRWTDTARIVKGVLERARP